MQKIEYLDPEIANEGLHADGMSDMEPPHIWDYSQLKSHKHYKKYFQGHVFRPYPAWLFHANEPSKIVMNAEEAAALGVSYNKEDNHWVCTGDWKAKPVNKVKPDLNDPSKSVIAQSAASAALSTNEIMAQILQKMNAGATPAALQADPDYAEFMAFKAWKKDLSTAPAAPLTAAFSLVQDDALVDPPAPVELSEAEQKAILVDAATEKGVKIDKRWGLDRIKEELDKVAA